MLKRIPALPQLEPLVILVDSALEIIEHEDKPLMAANNKIEYFQNFDRSALKKIIYSATID